MPQPLLEREQSPAAKEAKRRGLVYGGFSQWVDSNRVVRGKTVNKQFVPVNGEEQGNQQAVKGKVAVIDIDPDLLQLPAQDRVAYKYIKFIHSLVKSDIPVVLLLPRDLLEKATALFANFNSLNQKVHVAPFTKISPSIKQAFVAKLVKTGYKQIHYFDYSKKSIAAVDGLQARFNRAGVEVETHIVPPIRALLSREQT